MLLKLSGSENNLPGLDHGPLVPLQVVAGDHQEGEHGQSLDRHLLPHVVLGGGGPGQEGAHVLGQLALAKGKTVICRVNSRDAFTCVAGVPSSYSMISL